jgi:diaminohydroxyphosphoribosylaminopyrimidine deaminase/5-amino-6-(5-phosphoribosylamino)uracil reductase
LSGKLHLFDGKQKTICYNVLIHEENQNVSRIRVNEAGFLKNVIQDLYQRNLQSVIVEGGSGTLSMFLESGCWDEARIFTTPKKFEKGIKSPLIHGTMVSQQSIQGDWLKIMKPTLL